MGASRTTNMSDEEVDLFGEETAEEKETREKMEKKAEEEASKKKAKGGRSSVVLGVKPEDSDTDMKALEEAVRGLTFDGLEWKAAETKPIAFGLQLLRISCVIEDDKVSMDDVQEKIDELELVKALTSSLSTRS